MYDGRGTLVGALMIVSGASTVIMAGLLFLTFVWVCVGVLWLVPLAVGVAEIAVGYRILGRRPPRVARIVSVLGILAALSCMNVLGVILEGAALVVTDRPRRPRPRD